MQRIITVISAALALIGSSYAQEITLQGIPVEGSLANSVARQLSVMPKTESNDFSFDDITFWVGEGENEAALVLQWNDDREQGALVWGYRFDGSATGFDMLKAIASSDPRLYIAGSNSAYGYTVNGIGYDLDNDGDIALMNGDSRVEVVDGFADTPSSDLTAADADDLWLCGFSTEGYWAYYVDDAGNIPPSGYSTSGATGRKLADGSVDGWIYGTGISVTWKTPVAASAPVAVPEPPAEFTDGFFILNEGWMGHDTGSINWIGSDDTAYYNVDSKANDGGSVLGNTSDYGQVYGDYCYVMSKQAPRLVIMDATTLKVIKSFDSIGGKDGRGMLGVDEGKVYVGTSKGIFVLDVSNDFSLAETAIAGTEGQTGMMVRVGNYVFAAMQSAGLLVIDPATDKVVETIENSKICGVTASNDGTVWAVAGSDIIRVNPVTLENATLTLPDKMVSPWGSWTPDKICADPDEPALYYAYGKGSWANSENSIGKLTINADGTLAKDAGFAFTMPEAATAGRSQLLYGGIGIDPQSGYLIATATQDGYGENYSYNWVHYIDRSTGEVVKSTALKNDKGENYYWFPAMPVFPDNNAPEITLTDITLGKTETVAYNVTDIVSDADNMPALATVEAESGNESVFTVESNGFGFTVMPVATGSADMHLTVNSNGRIVSETVTVTVSETSGAAGIGATGSVAVYPTVATDVLNVTGLSQGNVAIYSMAGTQVIRHDLSTGSTIDLGTLAPGVYIVKVTSADTVTTAKIMKQ